jgi:hypothetical protein
MPRGPERKDGPITSAVVVSSATLPRSATTLYLSSRLRARHLDLADVEAAGGHENFLNTPAWNNSGFQPQNPAIAKRRRAGL